MARRDWYRRSTWTAAQREEFFHRLARCRPHNRALYLRIQAAALQAAQPDIALELLDYLLENHPDPDVLAGAHLDRARCLELLDRLLEAALAYRAAIAARYASAASSTRSSISRQRARSRCAPASTSGSGWLASR